MHTLREHMGESVRSAESEELRRIRWIEYYVSIGLTDRALELGWDGLPFETTDKAGEATDDVQAVGESSSEAAPRSKLSKTAASKFESDAELAHQPLLGTQSAALIGAWRSFVAWAEARPEHQKAVWIATAAAAVLVAFLLGRSSLGPCPACDVCPSPPRIDTVLLPPDDEKKSPSAPFDLSWACNVSCKRRTCGEWREFGGLSCLALADIGCACDGCCWLDPSLPTPLPSPSSPPPLPSPSSPPPLPPPTPRTATFEVVEFIVERGSWLFIFLVWAVVLLLRHHSSHSERHAPLGSEHHDAYQKEIPPYQSSGRLL